MDHGSWTMKKGHLPWSDFMVHGVNRPQGMWVSFGSFSKFSNFYQLDLYNNTRVYNNKNYDEEYAKKNKKKTKTKRIEN
jgi:hypothetical protein